MKNVYYSWNHVGTIISELSTNEERRRLVISNSDIFSLFYILLRISWFQ
jgi:hypothetical protein